MTHSPTVGAYVRIDDDCPISYKVLGGAETEFVCGNSPDVFEFAMTAEALLTEMDERYAEHAEAAGPTMTG